MKKVILSLVAACAITTAFAQNSASLSQSGTGNNSSTTQVGNLQNATVSQSGTGNYNMNQQYSHYYQVTNVTQIGASNAAYTYQNADAGPSNLINVYQNGTSNLAVANQSDYWTIASTAQISQVGGSHVAYVYQLGAYNDLAVVNQNGFGGRAYIQQGAGGYFSSSNSYALIEQLSVFGPQYGYIYQFGDNNAAYIYQDANAGPFNYATVYQSGNNNLALIDQSDYYTVYTTGQIVQTGNNNVAALYQYGGGANFSTNSAAYITQNGSYNTATLQQTGGVSNYANLTQNGLGNLIDGVSTSYGRQIGDNNSLVVTQTNNYGISLGQVAHVQQLGSGNTGVIAQSN